MAKLNFQHHYSCDRSVIILIFWFLITVTVENSYAAYFGWNCDALFSGFKKNICV